MLNRSSFIFFLFSLRFLFLEVTHFSSSLQSFFFNFLSFHSVLSHDLTRKRRKTAKRTNSFSLLSHSLTAPFLFHFLFHCQSDTYTFVARFKLFFFFSRKHKRDYACMSHDWTLPMIYGHFLFSFEWLCCHGLDWNMCLIFPFHIERWKIIILIFFLVLIN